MTRDTGGSSKRGSKPTGGASAVFDIATETGMLNLLRTIHRSALKQNVKNRLRDTLFNLKQDTQADHTAALAELAEAGFTVVYGEETAAGSPAADRQPVANDERKLGRSRNKPQFAPVSVPAQTASATAVSKNDTSKQAAPASAATASPKPEPVPEPEPEPEPEPASAPDHAPTATEPGAREAAATKAAAPTETPDAATEPTPAATTPEPDTTTVAAQPEASPATPTPEPPAAAPAAAEPPPAQQQSEAATDTAPTDAAAAEPTAPAQAATLAADGADAMERIKEIKRRVNEVVGNPITLMDIDNAVGREYMNALLAAMKVANGGTHSEVEAAIARLDKAHEAAIETAKNSPPPETKTDKFVKATQARGYRSQEQQQPAPTAQSSTASTSESAAESAASGSTAAAQPAQPKADTNTAPRAASDSDAATSETTPVSAETGATAKQTAGTVPVQAEAAAEPTAPDTATGNPVKIKVASRSAAQPTAEPEPESEPESEPEPEAEARSFTPSTAETPAGAAMRSVADQTQAAAPEATTETSSTSARGGAMQAASSRINQMSAEGNVAAEVEAKKPAAAVGSDQSAPAAPATPPAPEAAPSAEESAAAAEPAEPAAEAAQQPVTPATAESGQPQTTAETAADGRLMSVAKEEQLQNLMRQNQAEAAEAAKAKDEEMRANTDPLLHPEVTAGLNQLLSEWSLFKSSGFFGTGPSGADHPLYKKMAGLSMAAVIAGRFEGATPQVKQSITDYMNGWRYEEGIIHEHNETFEHYLRRVIRHILDKKTGKQAPGQPAGQPTQAPVDS